MVGMNVDIQNEKFSRVNIYLEKIFCHGFIAQNHRPVRVTATTASLLGHVLVRNYSNVGYRGISLSEISDHFNTFITLKHDLIRTGNSIKLKFREVHEQRKLKFFNEINQNSWASLMDIPDIDDCFNTFSNTIIDLFDRNFPYKEVTKKALDVAKPYIRRDFSTLTQESHRLQRIYRKYPVKYGDEYRACGNKVNEKIWEARDAYFMQ